MVEEARLDDVGSGLAPVSPAGSSSTPRTPLAALDFYFTGHAGDLIEPQWEIGLQLSSVGFT